jgi:PAS domain S-box-containing protein
MLKGFSIRGKIAVILCSLIMLVFVNVQAMVVFKIIESSYEISSFSFLCVMVFIPPFFMIISDVINYNKKQKNKTDSIELMLNESALISRADKQGKITFVNDKFCHVSGYKRQELLGKDHSVLNSGKQPKQFWLDMYRTVITYKSIWNEVVINKNKKGEEYIVDSWIKGEFDEKGKINGYISVRQDITNLVNSLDLVDRKSKEVKNVVSAINKSNATIEFTPQGNIITANKNFTDIMEYSLEEIQGEHHSIFVDDETKGSQEYRDFWKGLRSGKFKSGEFTRHTKSGKEVFIQGTYNPILENGKLIKVLKVVTDITESVIQKQEIERKNAYLEHAAKILRHDMHSGINTYIPRGLSSLKRRLKEDKIKELKIESPLKLLEEGLSHAQKVYNGVKEFTNLVKKDSKLSKTSCDLQYILKDYLKSTAYSSQVKIDELMVENVNESLFCTAIDNLTRNGLKYNDSKSKLVHIYKEDNAIVVEDNGRGMSKKDFEDYSKPYTRKEGQKEGGTGLGLNISIAIIKEHGFSISCEKLEPCGTKMIIEL